VTGQSWPWPDSMDAVGATPTSHRILLENDRVRVLEVTIEPGRREAEHTHRAASVMIVDEPARIRYYAPGEQPLEISQHSEAAPGPLVQWLGPEGPHSVENVDQHRYHAIRIELKGLTGC
jgi:predicted metal-dependent enzyme (double-stranded beta helix superfamily)